MESDLRLDDINTSELSTEELISTYEELDSFIKLVSDELKKTDIGDGNE